MKSCGFGQGPKNYVSPETFLEHDVQSCCEWWSASSGGDGICDQRKAEMAGALARLWAHAKFFDFIGISDPEPTFNMNSYRCGAPSPDSIWINMAFGPERGIKSEVNHFV